jgi:hypothetical protein
VRYAPRFCIAAAVLTGCLSCAGRSTTILTAPSAVDALPGLEPEDCLTQRMLRVRFQGRDARVSFRVILRLVDAGHYQLSAVDPLGRALWALEYKSPDVHFVNYRNLLECRTSGSVVISAVALETLPVADLSAILVGRLPAAVVSARLTESGRYVDSLGRQWSVLRDERELLGWTLWKGETPLLWFQHLEEGGILSHRGGGQFRWRETLKEALGGIPAPLSQPKGLRTVSCEEVVGEA